MLALAAGAAATYGVVAGGKALIERQVAYTRSITGTPLGWAAPNADGRYGDRYQRELLRIVVVGDSVAAGLGATLPSHTVGARVARRVARHARRPVRLRTVARIGAESRDLAGQLAHFGPAYRPDLAIVVVGGNDVLHRVPAEESGRNLAACVRSLQERGAAVVVGTCPDLGALKQVPQPLRTLASIASRQVAAAQARAVAPLGVEVVDLARVVGPFFLAHPEEMFALDRFHPSSLGYQRTARAMVPAALRAIDARGGPIRPAG
ncbi:lysophospholipase L1-like esterase [Nocardioides thalensis]|uniref:Lysophospholipase L1-like esterase n=1 Tax=Nocardioides thalensis TaxID=1914755 RepID=A0A853BY46_9ACTN|nr:lysophospholipase L1-like esterase [Nocardioides thalensis]